MLSFRVVPILAGFAVQESKKDVRQGLTLVKLAEKLGGLPMILLIIGLANCIYPNFF